MKKEFAWILGILLFVIFALLLGMYSRNITHLKTKEELELYKDEVNDLYQMIGEYENNENWYEDWVEVIIEVKNQEMQNAILEERIYWLERCQEPTVSQQQMYDDFEELIEIIIHYYENTDQIVELETYLKTNCPALYERIMGY